MYMIRIDDASEYMDVEKWNVFEELLDKYEIKPIVGIIPNNQDVDLVSKYQIDSKFWNKARAWQSKKWTIGLHGYTHANLSNSGGINPVNYQSEFAGVRLEEQKKKIANGIRIFKENGLNPDVFFAPSHTFDINTLEALRVESDIRVVSDTVANNIFKMGEFYFIPQQSGHVRKLPFKVITFCYHPNNMNEKDYNKLEVFIIKYKEKFGSFKDITFVDRKPSLYDKGLRKLYFLFRAVREIVRRK